MGAAYQQRVCVDFSRKALLEARETLGSNALPVLADITALPFREDTFDAVLCAHVIYHIPQEEQTGAIEELNRVLGINGTGVVVYTWSKCLMTTLALFLNPRLWAPKIPGMRWLWRRFFKKTAPSPNVPKGSEHPPLFFGPQDYTWYQNE